MFQVPDCVDATALFGLIATTIAGSVATAAVDAALTAAHCAAATPSQMPCIQTKLPPPSVITSQVWVVPAASLPVTVPAPAKAGTDIHSASAAPVSSLAKRLIAARPSWLSC